MLARMATLGEVMTKDVLSVEPSDTIGEAAEKMTEQGVGAVVVSDFGRMIGIFTERDLMRAVAGRVCAGAHVCHRASVPVLRSHNGQTRGRPRVGSQPLCGMRGS